MFMQMIHLYLNTCKSHANASIRTTRENWICLNPNFSGLKRWGIRGLGSAEESWLMVTWKVDDCAEGRSVGPGQVRADVLVGKVGTHFFITSSRTTDVVAGRDFTT